MESNGKHRSVAGIVSEMAEMVSGGAFLPGSVRRSKDRRRNAAGETVAYDAQPIYTFSMGGSRLEKRIPKEAYGRVLKLTGNYRRFKGLLRELEAAMVAEFLPGSKKYG